jgi:PIN domain nuclease of toxin-antitoxin system
MSLLLDTHAVIWLFEDMSLAPKAMSAIEAAYRDDTPLLVSPITAWEIGQLISLNRISLRSLHHSCRASRRAIPPTASCWRPRAISARRW